MPIDQNKSQVHIMNPDGSIEWWELTSTWTKVKNDLAGAFVPSSPPSGTKRVVNSYVDAQGYLVIISDE